MICTFNCVSLQHNKYGDKRSIDRTKVAIILEITVEDKALYLIRIHLKQHSVT